ncbi:hypothetical protein GOFOIKOB_3852 [Methylobacterium tardum]|nr:hypothetical protein GOFOIKOB_3852 [Methylobacterium tardum]
MGDLVDRGGGLLHGGELLLDRGRLLLRRGADLGRGCVQVGGGGPVGAREIRQPRHHRVQRRAEAADLVTTARVELPRQIALADTGHERHDRLQRAHHRAADQPRDDDREENGGRQCQIDREAGAVVDVLCRALAQGHAAVQQGSQVLDPLQEGHLEARDLVVARLDGGRVLLEDGGELGLAQVSDLAEGALDLARRRGDAVPGGDAVGGGREGPVLVGELNRGGEAVLHLGRGLAPLRQRVLRAGQLPLRLRLRLRLRQHRDHRSAAQDPEIPGLVPEIVELAQHRHVTPHDRVRGVAHRPDLLQRVEAERHDHHRDGKEAEEDSSSDRERHGRGWLQ